MHWPRAVSLFLICAAALSNLSARADTTQVLDLPTRPGVIQRLLVTTPERPKAVAVMFAGGNGALQIDEAGTLKSLKGNFLIRTRQAWVDKGFTVALVDAPSDRQSEPFLSGFRQTPQHLADIKAVIAALRSRTKLPVWLVGTSRGTQSVAFIATSLQKSDGPDGIVLTSSILTDPRSRPVPAMALEKLIVPTLVVHHRQDACILCSPIHLPALMSKLSQSPRSEVMMFDGGSNEGDPCEALAWHGYNGIESEVIDKIAAWILTN